MSNNINYKIAVKNFSYNPVTGELKRLTRKNSNGSYDKDGYLIIKFKGKQYKSHRLCWLIYFGEFPKNEIDHINGIRDDNRILNLRDVNRIFNTRNTKAKGYYCDNRTKGLIKKYTLKFNKKTYRFYTEKEVKRFRKKIDKEYNFIRRYKCII